MNKLLCYILPLFAILTGCNYSRNIEPDFGNRFVKYFGTTGNQTAVDMKMVSDGLIILGETSSPNGNKLYLAKSDFNGNELWSNAYAWNDRLSYEGNALTISSSGNIVVASTIHRTTDTDIMLLRVDPNGVQLDSAVYGNPGYNETAEKIIQTSNGSFLVVGTSFDASPDGQKYGIKAWRTYPSSLDTLPKTEWNSIYSKGVESYGASALEYNGEYFILGSSNANTDLHKNLALQNLSFYSVNETGGNFDNTPFGTQFDDYAVDMVKTSGGFALLGNTFDGTQSGVIIQVISNISNSIDQIIRSDTRFILPTSFEILDDGYVVLATETLNTDDSNIHLSFMTTEGVVWEKSYGGLELDRGSKGIAVLPNGSILFLGTVELNNQFKIALFKTDREGDLNIKK